MGGASSYLHLRFAVISLLLAGLIGGLAILTSRALARDTAEEAAAANTARLIEPLRPALAAAAADGDLSASEQAALDELVAPLVPSILTSVAAFLPDGTPLYATGGVGGAAEPPGGGLSWRHEEAGGAGVFVTAVAGDAYFVEAAEDGAALAGRITSQQNAAMRTAVLATGLLYLLLQGGFWLIVRRVTADHHRLARLYVASEQLRSSLDLHDVLTRLTCDATATVKGDFGMVALYDHESGDMLLRCTYETATGNVSHHQRAIEEWYMRRCVITNTTIMTGQAADAFHQFFHEVPDEGDVNVLCVPMTLRDRVVGVVAVLRNPTARRNGFEQGAVQLVLDLAVQGAVAVEQADLFAKVRAYASELELSYDSTLKALTAALDAKDDVTEGHCERVSRLTAVLARHLGLPERALVDIERGALLHDVGKIGVPDAVLKKPDSLTEQEWEAIRKHPLLAGVMISKVGFLEGATPILMYHHERWDGQGYPFGLAGEKIPLEARIFSVVDAYDAITSDRPYRDARPHEAAMQEIAGHAGSQFDPAVVDAFQRLMAASPEHRARPALRRDARHGRDDEEGLALSA